MKFDLNLIETKKNHDVLRLIPKHISQHKTVLRLLHENYLAGEKQKYIVTVDEAWTYLSDHNRKRLIYYWKRGEKDLPCWFRENM